MECTDSVPAEKLLLLPAKLVTNQVNFTAELEPCYEPLQELFPYNLYGNGYGAWFYLPWVKCPLNPSIGLLVCNRTELVLRLFQIHLILIMADQYALALPN